MRKSGGIECARKIFFISIALWILILWGSQALSQSVTYQFSDSVPFNESDQVYIEAEIEELIDTKRSQDSGNCTVRFIDNKEFSDRFGDDHTAWWLPKPCRIYFNSWYYPTFSKSSFITVLAHELGHAWGLSHSSDKASIMYDGVLSFKDLTEEDERIFSLATLYASLLRQE